VGRKNIRYIFITTLYFPVCVAVRYSNNLHAAFHSMKIVILEVVEIVPIVVKILLCNVLLLNVNTIIV